MDNLHNKLNSNLFEEQLINHHKIGKIAMFGREMLNATDLLLVVNFYRLIPTCQQVATNLLKSGLSFADLLQLVQTTCIEPVDNRFGQ